MTVEKSPPRWRNHPVDRKRIERAIELACDSIRDDRSKSLIPTVTDEVVKDLNNIYGEIFVNRVPTVEDIQDIVERELVRANHAPDLAKSYIIYREGRRKERAERHERLVREFEEKTLKVTKADGSKERFDVNKLRVVFDRASKGFEETCHFEDLMDSFKKNLVDDIKTSDIEALLVKTCVDLVTVENIAWQNIAARILLGGLYKKAIKNRGIDQKDIYSAAAYKAHFDDYITKGLYYKEFYDYYSEADILEAGNMKETDESYEYTTIVSFIKRYLLNPNKVVRELPQEMYMSVALFLAIPEKKEDRLALALKIYEHCSKQRISLPTPTLLNARTNYHQLSSCFKINVDDDLRGIYHAVENMAQISKFGGGVGVYLGNIRARGSAIRGVKGMKWWCKPMDKGDQ